MTSKPDDVASIVESVLKDRRYGYPDNPLAVREIPVDQLSAAERSALPPWWIEALQAPARSVGRIVADEWNTQLAGSLPQTATLFRDHLTGVRLLNENGRYGLIYMHPFADRADVVGPWHLGYQPTTPDALDVPDYFQHYPAALQRFYTGLHNGWTAGLDFGPLPLGRPVREIIEASVGFDLEEYNFYGNVPAPVSLDTLVRVATWHKNRLCVDTATGQAWNISTDLDPDAIATDLFERLDDYNVGIIYRPPFDAIY